MTQLADTSAWIWSRRHAYPRLRNTFDSALIDGELATCDMVALELLSSARNPEQFAEIREELAALTDCPDRTRTGAARAGSMLPGSPSCRDAARDFEDLLRHRGLHLPRE